MGKSYLAIMVNQKKKKKCNSKSIKRSNILLERLQMLQKGRFPFTSQSSSNLTYQHETNK